ncbi:hypothetical protein B0H16DRAFT_1747816 [Mycena metata]|uniref:Uncharacterized protein n=1 Tax=Mycena metata TaxID=1033252 RepID=A0AAD7GRQ4_9AGAR|nr:hypothetical protein B0H16DRAFT_1747816 [Mycena metata]
MSCLGKVFDHQVSETRSSKKVNPPPAGKARNNKKPPGKGKKAQPKKKPPVPKRKAAQNPESGEEEDELQEEIDLDVNPDPDLNEFLHAGAFDDAQGDAPKGDRSTPPRRNKPGNGDKGDSSTPPRPDKPDNAPPAPPRTNDAPPTPPRTNDATPTPPRTNDTPPAPPHTDDTPPAPPRTDDTPPAPPRTDDKPPDNDAAKGDKGDKAAGKKSAPSIVANPHAQKKVELTEAEKAELRLKRELKAKAKEEYQDEIAAFEKEMTDRAEELAECFEKKPANVKQDLRGKTSLAHQRSATLHNAKLWRFSKEINADREFGEKIKPSELQRLLQEAPECQCSFSLQL